MKLFGVLASPTSENSTFFAPMVWRTPSEQFHRKCTVPTGKHADSSVMVCGCFTLLAVGKLCVLHRNMERFNYRDILEENLFAINRPFKIVVRMGVHA